MSDTSQGPGWWVATDGKWYPPEQAPSQAPAPAPTPATAAPAAAPGQPPAPGWWLASDGNWYPPAGPAPSPTGAAPAAPGAPADAGVPGAAGTPAAPGPAGAPVGPTPDPAPAAAAAPKKSGKGLLIAGAVFVVLVLIAAGTLVIVRNGSSSSSGGGVGGDRTQVGAPRTDGQPAVPALGDDAMPDPGVKLTSDVVVVRGNGGRTIVSAAPDGHTMVLDKNVEGVDKLEAGKVLLLTGMTVVKVASVQTSGENKEITTEPATLPDVFEDADLSWKDQPVDPAKAQLVITGDQGWEYGPNGDGGAGSSGSGGSGSGSGNGSGSGDGSGSGSDTDTTDSSLVDPGDLELGAGVRPATGEGESAAGATRATRAAAAKTVTGSAGEFDFALTYEGEGTGHHLDLKLTSKGDTTGTIDTDIHINSLANSGNIDMKGRKLQNFDFTLADLGGTAEITTDLKGLQNTAKWQTPAFFKLPFSLDFPAFVGGIPFTLSLSGVIQVNLVFSLANSSLSGKAEITYSGDAGFHVKAKKLSLDGKREQDSPDLLKTIQGVAPGPVGVVFTTELPKIGFGFKFLQTGAGVYISNGAVVAQDILPPPVPCTAANVAYVLAGGVEASFLGKDFEIARKAFVDKRWEWAAPNDKRCKGAKPGG